ncbi:cytochrome P450 18a1 [Drosophila busckii]|uniref:cytochrome P450 18a1 n=1 Tax=Drosophila busckii TaxID=30019 RepID=UPI00143313B7|nr:cytochrome P450 18a1 [Drosophila busckii]
MCRVQLLKYAVQSRRTSSIAFWSLRESDSYLIKCVLRQLQLQEQQDAQHLLFVFLCFLTLISGLQWLLRQIRALRKLPPGPWGLPVIGYLLFMGNEKHTRFMELAKRYGSLFSARLGTQ